MENKKTPKQVYIIILLLMVIIFSIGLYIFARTFLKSHQIGVAITKDAFISILNRSIPAIIAMTGSGICIAFLSVSFQTTTNSRVLTPSMLGFDSIFIGTQTIIVFVFGSGSKLFFNPYINYFTSAGIMVLISMLMYKTILRKNKNNIILLLLFGLILSQIVKSATSYMQVIMDQSDYYDVLAATSVTINNINTSIIYLAVPMMILLSTYIFIGHKTYDVLLLGEESSINLGINYNKEVKKNLILISIGMSITTALIGSLSFLGLLVVNISKEIFKTYKHKYIFIGSSLIAIIALILGQSLVEILGHRINVMVIIDLTGCTYLFYLIIKENKKI